MNGGISDANFLVGKGSKWEELDGRKESNERRMKRKHVIESCNWVPERGLRNDPFSAERCLFWQSSVEVRRPGWKSSDCLRKETETNIRLPYPIFPVFIKISAQKVSISPIKLPLFRGVQFHKKGDKDWCVMLLRHPPFFHFSPIFPKSKVSDSHKSSTSRRLVVGRCTSNTSTPTRYMHIRLGARGALRHWGPVARRRDIDIWVCVSHCCFPIYGAPLSFWGPAHRKRRGLEVRLKDSLRRHYSTSASRLENTSGARRLR